MGVNLVSAEFGENGAAVNLTSDTKYLEIVVDCCSSPAAINLNVQKSVSYLLMFKFNAFER